MISSLGSHALKALTPQTAVRVDRSRCVRHRCERNDCRKCLDVCPSGAITWDEQGLQVESETCVQCLLCMAVCPTAALQSPELSLPRIVSDLAAHPAPVLGCDRQSEPESHARMSCLGYLAHPEVMLLLALVHDEGLQINLTSCRECPNGQILEGVREAHARVSDLKPDHGLKLVYDRSDLAYEPSAVSRRELFAFFRERSTRTAAVMVERLQADPQFKSYGDKQVPATRVMLLKAMERLPEACRLRIADRLFGRISFTPTCTPCGGCAGVCPTGAIRSADGADELPSFDRDLCVACESCQAFCGDQGVVVVRDEQPLADDPRHAADGDGCPRKTGDSVAKGVADNLADMGRVPRRDAAYGVFVAEGK